MYDGGGRTQEARRFIPKPAVRRRCRGKVIRLHDDIVFTRETNYKLARARARGTLLEVEHVLPLAAIPRTDERGGAETPQLAETPPAARLPDN